MDRTTAGRSDSDRLKQDNDLIPTSVEVKHQNISVVVSYKARRSHAWCLTAAPCNFLGSQNVDRSKSRSRKTLQDPI